MEADSCPDKIFDGALSQVLEALNEAIWAAFELRDNSWYKPRYIKPSNRNVFHLS